MIWNYLKHQKKGIFLYLLCLAIFTLVFFLSNIQLDAVLYGGLLCAIVSLCFFGYDYYQFSGQHRELSKLLVSIDAQIDRLPSPRNLIDEDYNEILKELHRQKREAEGQFYTGEQALIDYFSLWAHQVKTPIAAMGLILQSKGAHGTKEDKALALELFHLEEYVDMVLTYVRARDMSGDLHFEEVELDQLIGQCLKKYAPLFIGRKISVDFQPTDWRVVTDKKWFSFVLGQLLSNGLKYTQEKGRISLYMEGRDLIVEDTGVGIKEEDLPRIFQKGFTGYNGRLYSKSTGQGLYLCKLIMEKLSHEIHAVSEEGKGTKMILTLPDAIFQ